MAAGLEKGVLAGISLDNLPLTHFDVPSLALANMLRGNVEATGRAILSRDSLTPSELRTMRMRFLKGAGPNPLVRMAVGIGTNPLVWVGLLLSIKFPRATASQMAAAARDMGKKAPIINSMQGLGSSATTIFRDNPKILDIMADDVRLRSFAEAKWGTGLHEVMDVYVKKTGRMPTKQERILLGMFAEGWHTTESYLQRTRPKWVGGVERGPLAPGLEKAMSQPLKEAAVGITKLRDTVYADVMELVDAMMAKRGEGAESRLLRTMEKDMLAKGIIDTLESQKSRLEVTGLGHVTHYLPRVTGRTWSEREQSILMGLGKPGALQYKYIASRIGPGGESRFVRARTPNPMPSDAQLEMIEKSFPGVLRPGLRTELQQAAIAQQVNLHREMVGVIQEMQHLGTAHPVAAAKAERGFRAFVSPNEAMRYARRRLIRIFRREGMGADAAKVLADDMITLAPSQQAVEQYAQTLSTRLGAPDRYTLDAVEAMDRYVRSMATTYAWFPSGVHREFKREVEKLGAEDWRRDYAMSDLAPALRGLTHWREFSRKTMMRDIKLSLTKTITGDGPAARLFRQIPAGTQAEIKAWLGDEPGSLDEAVLGSKITGWFGLSTLGMNISSASFNSLQQLLIPARLGTQAWVEGLLEVAKRTANYTGLLHKGVEKNKAFDMAFSEYVRGMGKERSLLDSLVTGTLASEQPLALPMEARNAGLVFKRILMMPFAATETFNRLTAFYSGHGALKKEMARGAKFGEQDAIRLGWQMVQETQYPGGPMGTPRRLMGVWGPNKQFMHYPIRYLETLMASLRWGPDPTKRDFGFMGRLTAGSAVAYEGGKALLGLDLSRGLLAGSLPIPMGGVETPFYPWPLVPPMWGAMGNLAMMTLAGDPERLGRTAALAIPGGLAVRRAYRTLSPRFAAWDRRLPDGRVPVKNDEGMVIGSYTPMQIYLRSMGLTDPTMVQERVATRWLLAQRDQIRGYRNAYMEALMQNDMEQAGKVREEFARRYPELGELKVKPENLRGIKERRETARITRVLRGFPKEYRPLFDFMVGQSRLHGVVQQAPMFQ